LQVVAACTSSQLNRVAIPLLVVRLDIRAFLICADIDDFRFLLPTRFRWAGDWRWRRECWREWTIVFGDTMELKHASWSVLLVSCYRSCRVSRTLNSMRCKGLVKSSYCCQSYVLFGVWATFSSYLTRISQYIMSPSSPLTQFRHQA
jgi:hypothetical protein